MTWSKTGIEFPDECAEAGLTDAEYRTHHEAISYAYRVEDMTLTLKKSTMRRWAGSDQAQAAADGLVRKGFWQDNGTSWTVLHHGEVVRQSIVAQQTKRDGDRVRKQRQRERQASTTKPTPVTGDVTRDVSATQTDRQTSRQRQDAMVNSMKNGIQRSLGNGFSAPCPTCGEPLSWAAGPGCDQPGLHSG